MDDNTLPDIRINIPAETALELQANAKEPTKKTLGERTADTAQTALVFGAIAGCVTAASFGWAKAMDWLEERKLRREMRKSGIVPPTSTNN